MTPTPQERALTSLVSYLNDERCPSEQDLPWVVNDITVDAEQLATVIEAEPEKFKEELAGMLATLTPILGQHHQVGFDVHEQLMIRAQQILCPLLEEERDRRLEEDATETDAQIFERECA